MNNTIKFIALISVFLSTGVAYANDNNATDRNDKAPLPNAIKLEFNNTTQGPLWSPSALTIKMAISLW
ncbi:MAG: hypothetical protein ACU83U_11605 [Gammaproteobacteria bacterium]